MSEVQQPLNRTAFEDALRARNLKQASVADLLGVNPKSFSRWINEGHIPTRHVLDLSMQLDLNDEELAKILNAPKYAAFFRKKFLGKVPEGVEARAIELAQTLFSLTYLNAKSHFFPTNLSRSTDSAEVADQIRKLTGLNNFKSLSTLISRLAEQGVEVGVIPFAKMGLHSSEKKLESAFSVSDGKRWLIFLDAECCEELLIFNLCHELGHLFRPDLEFSKTEEAFCNEVASELMFPISFIRKHDATIRSVVSANSIEKKISLIRSIQEQLGGELLGIAIRLKALGYLSQKDPNTGRLIGYAKKLDMGINAEKQESSPFASFDPSNKTRFFRFWGNSKIARSSMFRFFMHVQNAALEESVSSRKFSEIFGSELGLSDELVVSWRNKLRHDLALSEDA